MYRPVDRWLQHEHWLRAVAAEVAGIELLGGEQGGAEVGHGTFGGAEEGARAAGHGLDGGGLVQQCLGEGEQAPRTLDEERHHALAPRAELAPVGLRHAGDRRLL